jgi:hypothetical protein
MRKETSLCPLGTCLENLKHAFRDVFDTWSGCFVAETVSLRRCGAVRWIHFVAQLPLAVAWCVSTLRMRSKCSLICFNASREADGVAPEVPWPPHKVLQGEGPCCHAVAPRSRCTRAVSITGHMSLTVFVLSRSIFCGLCAHRQLGAGSRPQWTDDRRSTAACRWPASPQQPEHTIIIAILPSSQNLFSCMVLFGWCGVVWWSRNKDLKHTKATKPLG